MKKAWQYISTLGIPTKSIENTQRTNILGNQLNAIVFFATLLLLVILRIDSQSHHLPMSIGSLRVALLSLMALINLLAASFTFHSFSKISLIVLTPLIFLLFPTFIGFVEEESFVYYPYFIIAFSILPQLLFYPDANKAVFLILLIYYLLLTIFIDSILEQFMPYRLPIVDRIESFYLYYKLSHIFLFFFINIAVFYLILTNRRFEINLDNQNQELKKAIKKLRKTQQQLIQSEKMAAMGTLVAGVAHEINNPLNYINGGLTLLDELKQQKKISIRNDATDDYKMIESMIQSGIDRISRIVSSLITFAGKQESRIVESNLNELIDNTLLFLRSEIPLEVKYEKEYHLNRKVAVYPDQIHQVLYNVLSNSIYEINKIKKSYKAKLSIKTGIHNTEDNQELAMIQIENTGSNISPSLLKKVFDPFFTTKEPSEGTGLGLSVSYEIIKNHNGSIEMKNTPTGVKCIILLPL
ncbi:MAG: GHKL domain-containing protein [Bacteroidales bacterium]|nr:GHKL domain-containing protein [Bacteroidales bacterium]